MVFNANIFRCRRCECYLLSEEIDTHQCLEIKEQTIEGDLLWINDGVRKYPIKRTNGKSTTCLNRFGQPLNNGRFNNT
jgi:hypothetical protein